MLLNYLKKNMREVKKIQRFRCEPSIWEKSKVRAEAKGTTRSEICRKALIQSLNS